MKVRFITITPDAEKTIGYIARVSNPKNQENEDITRLIRYCMRAGHWSVFEQASLTLEIETSLAIAMQILRHKSFCFQMFSQRYQDAGELGDGGLFEPIELRRQDTKNRQSSHDDLPKEVTDSFQERIAELLQQTEWLYNDMLDAGIAKECARFILPQATKTRLYMTGNIRSWLTYFMQRVDHGAQKEHRLVAEAALSIFEEHLPVVTAAYRSLRDNG